jgi:hypothetical protein
VVIFAESPSPAPADHVTHEQTLIKYSWVRRAWKCRDESRLAHEAFDWNLRCGAVGNPPLDARALRCGTRALVRSIAALLTSCRRSPSPRACDSLDLAASN